MICPYNFVSKSIFKTSNWQFLFCVWKQSLTCIPMATWQRLLSLNEVKQITLLVEPQHLAIEVLINVRERKHVRIYLNLSHSK